MPVNNQNCHVSWAISEVTELHVYRVIVCTQGTCAHMPAPAHT